MRTAALLLLLLPIAACERPQPPAKAPVAVNPGPPGPPLVQPPSYIGRWAARPELCTDGAWVLTERGLTTAGEVSCGFTLVTANDTGWIAEGECQAQGPATRAALVLNTTRAGARRTLAISGGPFKDAPVLIQCPMAPAAAAAPLVEANAIDAAISAPQSEVKVYDVTLNQLVSQAWRVEGTTVDGLIRITEPVLGDLGRKLAERRYYYRLGTTEPFLIRESEASYAIDSGKVVSVYSRDGVELQMPATRDKAELERRLIGRATQLRTAAEAAATPGAPPARRANLKP